MAAGMGQVAGAALADSSPFATPYGGTPGSSTPGPAVDPKKGRRDLIDFAVLSLANTAIISVVGVVTWFLIR